ncbi:Transposase for transposon Tn5 [Sodalis glossinidius str. 'morsitans']|uniref:Transposase for transposon Tn5 n=1 Tax=Sodalis glossinidius (strain morsitans) TaxID=343509 RepID=Q2NQE6_SODGM|nr:IS4 family transposase [Sodalis glossinidius]BAE75629.1 conserved hypothetical protein [Sodalis glossinidius str. 'morsitans']CRL46711.1 Transposase for transposon Tn5 [Sodalis glossinidius str. 'morsitans']
MSWAEEELGTVNLGDARRDRRAVLLLERLDQKPSASIPRACECWAETAAAYRFLRNDDVRWNRVMEPHWQASQARMGQHEVVLCLQDTTELNYNGQDIEGLGPLNYETQRGLYLHPTYVVSTQREPLGVTNAWSWARKFKDDEGVRGGITESIRWIESYERMAESAAALPTTRHVCVGDRESDMIELMLCARNLGYPVDYLIRNRHNHALPGSGKLWDQVQAAPLLGRIRFELPRGRGRKTRQVEQEIRLQYLSISDGVGGKLEVSCLIARYRARWEIELFFLVLKEGCRVERLQLGNKNRLETALALYMVIAWRINRLMRLGRNLPELDADLLFETDEWRAAFILNKKPIPKTMPTLNQVIRLIARRGGFLGRKGDGEPGTRTLWLGLQEVSIFVEGACYARQIALRTCV